MPVDLFALNVAVFAANVYLLLRTRARLRSLRRIANDFTKRLLSGHVLVLGADTGRIGRLCVSPVGDDAMCLSIDPTPNGWHLCGRCYDECDDANPLVTSPCDEHPELLTGAPIGMYHCPECGAMLLAGLPHPRVCRRCHDRRHPGFDVPHLH